jgi:hypothetical protein
MDRFNKRTSGTNRSLNERGMCPFVVEAYEISASQRQSSINSRRISVRKFRAVVDFVAVKAQKSHKDQ